MNKIDSVLITKVLDSKTYTQRVTDVSGGYWDHFGPVSSGRGGGWYGDFYYGHTATTYETEFKVFNLETSLYSADGEKLSWAHQQEVDAWFEANPAAGVVGAFEGAGYSSEGMFRSQLDCIMFTKGVKPFCAACRRGIVEIIQRYGE